MNKDPGSYVVKVLVYFILLRKLAIAAHFHPSLMFVNDTESTLVKPIKVQID